VRDRLPLFFGLIALAAAIVFGSIAIAGGIRDRNQGDVITVTGSAKKRIKSDYVVWDFSVTSQERSPGAAATGLEHWTSRIQAFLEAEGVRPDELSLQPVSTESVAAFSNGQDTGKVLGYKLTRSFEVRSPRVSAIARVAEHSSRLFVAGIPVTAQPLQYVYTKLPSLRPPLLAEATKDAQGRAQVLTAATGARLGKLRGVDVGVFQVTTPNSTEVSDYGAYDTSTFEKDVTAVVNVTFSLR
jgi:uncharacterized protein